MPVIYVGSFPPDSETDLKNFQRKQAEFKIAYHHTGDRRALVEALLNARSYLEFPADLDWLVAALGDTVMKGKIGKKLRKRMRDVRRYRCVEDLRQKEGHIKEVALDLAAVALAATDAAAARSTIEDSYDKVKSDLKRKGRDSEYFLLDARSKPTVVPVSPAVIQHARRKANEQPG